MYVLIWAKGNGWEQIHQVSIILSKFKDWGRVSRVHVNDLHLFIYFYSIFIFLGPHLWHTEVPRLGVASATYTTVQGNAGSLIHWAPPVAFGSSRSRGCIFETHHSPRQHQILNPPIEARDWTLDLMDTSQVCYWWTTMGMRTIGAKKSDEPQWEWEL